MNVTLLPILLSAALGVLAYVGRRSYVIAVALLVALIPTYLIRAHIAGIPTNFFELSVLVLLCVGLLQKDIRAQWLERSQKIPRPVFFWVILFLMAIGMSVGISSETQVSLGIVKGWVAFPLLTGWLVYATALPPTVVVKALAGSATVVSMLSLATFSYPARLAGIYDVPNSLALYLAPILVLTCWSALHGPSRWWWSSVVLQTSALLATQSALGVGAAVIAIAIGSLVWLPAPKRRSALGGLAVVLVIIAVIFTVTDRIQYLISPLTFGTPNSVSVRMQLWSIGWDLVKEHPLLGVGLGQFEGAYQLKVHQRFLDPTQVRPLPEFVFRDPHNWPLSFWLNTGLLGLIGFIAVHIVLVRRTFYSLDRSKIPEQATILALLCILLFGLADTTYWKNDLAALHWTLLSLLFGAGIYSNRADTSPSIADAPTN